MWLGLNGATTMYADLATDITVAAAAGYDVLEIWASKLDAYLKEASLESLKERFSAAGVAPFAINSVEDVTFATASQGLAVRERCLALARQGAVLKVPWLVVVPGPKPPGVGEKMIIEESARVLQELANLVEPFGMGLAFEFIGRRACSVSTLEVCRDIVEEVDRANVRMVIDTFHFYAGGGEPEDLTSMDPALIALVHINDAEDLPRSALTDAHRLYPGKGIIPLEAIMTELVIEAGYSDTISVELFRPEYWNLDPGRVAREAKESVNRLFKKVGMNSGA